MLFYLPSFYIILHKTVTKFIPISLCLNLLLQISSAFVPFYHWTRFTDHHWFVCLTLDKFISNSLEDRDTYCPVLWAVTFLVWASRCRSLLATQCSSPICYVTLGTETCWHWLCSSTINWPVWKYLHIEREIFQSRLSNSLTRSCKHEMT